MNELQPLKHHPRYRDQLAGVGAVKPLSRGEREQLYWELNAKLSAPPRPSPLWAWGAAAVACCAVVAIGALRWRLQSRPATAVAIASAPTALPLPLLLPPPPTEDRILDLGATGRLTLSPEAQVDTEPPAEPAAPFVVSLRRGRFCAEIHHRDLERQGPLVVEAPSLTVTVVGTKFCVETADGQSRVTVSEGRIEASRRGGERVPVAAGESVHSEVLPLPGPKPLAAVPAPTVAPPEPPSCAAIASLDDREDCYAGRIGGEDLSAQEALFSLAVLARDDRHDGKRALSDFRAYLSRFPNGAYAPEADEGELRELAGEGRFGPALRVANDYLKRFGDQPRAAEVELVRARLLRDELGRPADALAVYERLLSQAVSPALRDETLFAKGLCQIKLANAAGARGTFERYTAEFPSGSHSAEVKRLLGPEKE